MPASCSRSGYAASLHLTAILTRLRTFRWLNLSRKCSDYRTPHPRWKCAPIKAGETQWYSERSSARLKHVMLILGAMPAVTYLPHSTLKRTSTVATARFRRKCAIDAEMLNDRQCAPLPLGSIVFRGVFEELSIRSPRWLWQGRRK